MSISASALWNSDVLNEKWSEYKKDRNNINLRNELVRYYANNKLINSVVKKFKQNDCATSNTNWSGMDYLSIAYEKLIECVEQYDPDFIIEYVSEQENETKSYKSKHNHKVSFEEYANPRLRLAIKEELRKFDTLSRYSRDAVNALKSARKAAGDDATVEDIINNIIIPKYVYSSNSAITQERYYKTGLTAESDSIIQRPAIMSTIYTDGDLGDDEDVSDFHNDIRDDDNNIEDDIDKKDMFAILYQIIDKFNDTDKFIIKYYFGIGLENENDKMDLKSIGEKLGKSEGRISQLKKAIEQKLRNEFAQLKIYEF